MKDPYLEERAGRLVSGNARLRLELGKLMFHRAMAGLSKGR
jgi:hypothetical protein